MTQRSISATRDRITATSALRAAALCAIGLALTWILAELLPVTHVKDAVALHDFTELSAPRLDLLANWLLSLLDLTRYILWGVALLSVALARGRPRVALAVVAIMALAPLTSELLKPLLAHSHVQIGWSTIVDASWPSGHSTAAMSLALSAVLVSPRDLRPAVAAIGTIFAVAVGFSLLVLAWHMPSDVFGGYLVAGLWSALALAALCFSEQRRPSQSQRKSGRAARARKPSLSIEGSLALVLSLCTALGAIALVVLARAHHAERLALEHPSMIVAAGAIAALAAVIASSMTFALER
jgi:membrane-associated phospholipid phosphatase